MNEQAEYRILVRAIDTYGPDAQLKMVLEEMSELQKEICKFWQGKDNKGQIAEEVADVEIMLKQVRMIFGIDQDTDYLKKQKLLRLMKRLDTGE